MFEGPGLRNFYLKFNLKQFPFGTGVDLTLERRDGHCQQEGVPQGVNGLQHTDVLDQRLVPQETQEQGHNDNVNGQNDHVINHLLSGTGLQEVEHLFIRELEKNSLIIR